MWQISVKLLQKLSAAVNYKLLYELDIANENLLKKRKKYEMALQKNNKNLRFANSIPYAKPI